jgi:cold shock CspA family protein
MNIEFGNVRDYNYQRGFGFVTRTFKKSYSRENDVFFHIKRVKKKFPDLAYKLDLGLFNDVEFWYLLQPGSKGDEVGELWLEATEIPNDARQELVDHFQKHWKDIDNPQPSWLEKLTPLLVGKELHNEWAQERQKQIDRANEIKAQQRRLEEEKRRQIEAERLRREEEAARVRELERQRREEEAARVRELERQAILKAAEEECKRAEERQRIAQEAARIAAAQREAQNAVRSESIKNFCHMRGISTLAHFTRVENLSSILQHGLLTRSKLEMLELEQRPKFNDDLRMDGCYAASCLSISFPNYRMFYRYRQINPGTEWVVLLLDASILWEMDCAFCYENAASNSVRHLPLEERKRFGALEDMFSDLSTPRQQLNIPDWFPTNPQAEVLAFNPIPLSYFRSVCFQTMDSLIRWRNQHARSNRIPTVVEEAYFSPRKDWSFWKQQPVYE